MLLNDGERDFLAAFIRESTTDPFKGPATEELHRRNIYYTDLSHLLAAYYQEGVASTEGFGGQYDPQLPACPWQDWEAAARRDHEIEMELGRFGQQSVA